MKSEIDWDCRVAPLLAITPHQVMGSLLLVAGHGGKSLLSAGQAGLNRDVVCGAYPTFSRSNLFGRGTQMIL